MDVLALGKIRHNGEDYKKGDIIRNLSSVDGERLIRLKVAELDDEDNVLTTEEFAKLKANAQKAKLEGLGIEPASNVEERIAQYLEWHQLKGGD
ncbi:hypothetical protein [Desulfitobacterium chlororespirans]|uniref:DUF7210 domain-containing protein n=1 Tax=Desulfitobacterium chlororespirans DSM 11544 TaxID=1121395 RepID=A0A1M7U2Q5_9FIRM|nr:hypothetical protein [Desulfitobacterium chlororespirans]SHN77289.1 hypothetical protein SAMN02745215_02866 [Desulfitobacterium chlororespirans DSM 11544]